MDNKSAIHINTRNPPQTEECKKYYLARAEAKRNRKKEARLYRKKWHIE